MITYHIMTEDEKEIISDWNYTGDYDFYNMPSYQQQKENCIGFGNPLRDRNFYSYYDGDKLIGFTNILEETSEVFLGIGVAPDMCSCGYGLKIIKIAEDISKELYPGKPIYLEVRTWNQRAINCYKKAGFVIEKEAFAQEIMLGTGEFFRMIYNP